MIIFALMLYQGGSTIVKTLISKMDPKHQCYEKRYNKLNHKHVEIILPKIVFFLFTCVFSYI